MNRIENRWKSFREKVISAEASEAQVTDMRHAFYAGVMTVLSISEEATNASEEVGETIIGNMYKEAARYRLGVIEDLAKAVTRET